MGRYAPGLPRKRSILIDAALLFDPLRHRMTLMARRGLIAPVALELVSYVGSAPWLFVEILHSIVQSLAAVDRRRRQP